MNRLTRNAVLFTLSALAVVLPSLSHAALPAGVETAFESMETDFTTIFGYGFAVLIAVVTAMIGWKYTRKLASKV